MKPKVADHRQLSLDGDFTPARDEHRLPARPISTTSREDPRKLESAYGIQPPAQAQPTVIAVDSERMVVEHTVGWLAACFEDRPIRVVERAYDGAERYEAVKRELEATAPLSAHKTDMLQQAVLAGHEAGKNVREMARELGKSPSLISRILGREQVRRNHLDIASRLKDSHLEAVIGCEDSEQRRLLEAALADNLSVHALEQLVRDRRVAFRKVIGTDQRYVEVLERTGLAKLAPDWREQRQEWVAWFRHALQQANPDVLPRGNKRHGRAA